uniref:snRNA-activating protein complex subunit 2 isoform X1 n=1 Tax=Jaculus jaculus TaxID=51337 RepID=UPI00033326B6|nr:snRNA-activating protein complex subunit 2 isoform X1 [Jaculus jaculus]
MKPPQRRRTVPARYLGEVTGPAAWSPREKRQLLRLLQSRRGQPEPDAAELATELQGRSEAEVRHFIQQLKGRVVREAIRKVHPGPRHCEAQLPAPIEVWTDLAEKLTGPLEEALTTAFSQVLTIAAAEPISLLHSKPPKPTKACGKPLLFITHSGWDPSAPKTSSQSPEASCHTPESSDPAPDAPVESLDGTSAEGYFSVDFEKIYKYLSLSSRSGHGLELSAAESAVVLDLLMSLPEELSLLPCTALVEHMNKTYAHLMTPQPNAPGRRSPRLGAEDGETGSNEPEEHNQANPQAPESRELRLAWQASGICPLNPFLVPLELLGRATTPAR